MIAKTPQPPYYAVIFTSLRTDGEQGYSKMSDKMVALAKQQKGFLGVESVRNSHELSVGITVSYWDSLAAIKNWKLHLEHTEARNKGRDIWYTEFKVRICKVERAYDFEKER